MTYFTNVDIFLTLGDYLLVRKKSARANVTSNVIVALKK